jgi:hypothetical protein
VDAHGLTMLTCRQEEKQAGGRTLKQQKIHNVLQVLALQELVEHLGDVLRVLGQERVYRNVRKNNLRTRSRS